MKARKTSTIEFRAATGKAFLPFLRRFVTRAIALIPRAPRDVSIALVGDATMSRLHVQFMQIEGTTDVLTFELDHNAKGRVTAGEIVICVPEARRQATRHGTRVERELLLYIIHGLLHLVGHDDHDKRAYAEMHKEEDRILTKLGIGPVFQSPLRRRVSTTNLPRQTSKGRPRR